MTIDKRLRRQQRKAQKTEDNSWGGYAGRSLGEIIAEEADKRFVKRKGGDMSVENEWEMRGVLLALSILRGSSVNEEIRRMKGRVKHGEAEVDTSRGTQVRKVRRRVPE
jgi:hypothetical protein